MDAVVPSARGVTLSAVIEPKQAAGRRDTTGVRTIQYWRRSVGVGESGLSGFARYVGRVGALAVALGVGSGLGSLQMAFADTTGSAGSSGSGSADSSSSSSSSRKSSPTRGPRAGGGRGSADGGESGSDAAESAARDGAGPRARTQRPVGAADPAVPRRKNSEGGLVTPDTTPRMQRLLLRMPSPRSPAAPRHRSPVRRRVAGPASRLAKRPRFRRPLR